MRSSGVLVWLVGIMLVCSGCTSVLFPAPAPVEPSPAGVEPGVSPSLEPTVPVSSPVGLPPAYVPPPPAPSVVPLPDDLPPVGVYPVPRREPGPLQPDPGFVDAGKVAVAMLRSYGETHLSYAEFHDQLAKFLTDRAREQFSADPARIPPYTINGLAVPTAGGSLSEVVMLVPSSLGWWLVSLVREPEHPDWHVKDIFFPPEDSEE